MKWLNGDRVAVGVDERLASTAEPTAPSSAASAVLLRSPLAPLFEAVVIAGILRHAFLTLGSSSNA